MICSGNLHFPRPDQAPLIYPLFYPLYHILPFCSIVVATKMRFLALLLRGASLPDTPSCWPLSPLPPLFWDHTSHNEHSGSTKTGPFLRARDSSNGQLGLWQDLEQRCSLRLPISLLQDVLHCLTSLPVFSSPLPICTHK